MTDYPTPDLKDLKRSTSPNENLIVRLWPPETKTKGGLDIPTAAQQKKAVAWVLSPLCVYLDDKTATSDEWIFSEGDTVIVPLHSIENIPELGDDVYYVRASDVILHYPVTK